jgi:acyl dehydratase
MATAAAGTSTQIHFEDVSEGMEIPGKSYGPVESTDLVRFCSAWETYSLLHTYQKWCLERGHRDVVINGPFKQAVLITWLDNWIGDDGFLKALSCQHRVFDFHDDVFTTSGVVTRTYEVDGFGYADCDIKLTNPRGEVSCPGTATVVLPKRNGPPAPIEYAPPPEYFELLKKLASGEERIADVRPDQGLGDLIPEKARNTIGMRGYSHTWAEPVDRGTIRRYCDATYEWTRIYRDEEYAKQTRYGALCAPPITVLRVPYNERGMMGESAVPHVELAGQSRGGGNAGNEAEWFKPVKLGDTITQTAYLSDLVQRTGRSGKMVIVYGETLYVNQRGELVAKSRQGTLRQM